MSENDTSSGELAVRPQPLGAYRLPAGYLLVGTGPTESDTVGEVRRTLLSGRLPDAFPDELTYYALALDGDAEGALTELDRIDGRDNTEFVIAANRFVLDGTPESYQRARELAGSQIDWLAYLDTIAFVVGLRATPPAVAGGAEIAALTGAAQASVALERNDLDRAAELLDAASQAAHPVSKAITGQLLGQLANVLLDAGAGPKASVTFDAAFDALADTSLFVERAELHVAAGAMYQEMSEAAPRLLQQAINHYQKAVGLINAEDAPETLAIANANLGLAYVTMPMQEASDQLRLGVAIQSMRDALAYFTPERHPDRWGSTLLNLANALVYLPSNHQADNIAEAVALYEELLATRSREDDPTGRARVLANQGNALAHLGRFDDARARLAEARSIFEEFEQVEAVQTVREILDGIVKREQQNSGATAPRPDAHSDAL